MPKVIECVYSEVVENVQSRLFSDLNVAYAYVTKKVEEQGIDKTVEDLVHDDELVFQAKDIIINA